MKTVYYQIEIKVLKFIAMNDVVFVFLSFPDVCSDLMI